MSILKNTFKSSVIELVILTNNLKSTVIEQNLSRRFSNALNVFRVFERDFLVINSYKNKNPNLMALDEILELFNKNHTKF